MGILLGSLMGKEEANIGKEYAIVKHFLLGIFFWRGWEKLGHVFRLRGKIQILRTIQAIK